MASRLTARAKPARKQGRYAQFRAIWASAGDVINVEHIALPNGRACAPCGDGLTCKGSRLSKGDMRNKGQSRYAPAT